MGLGPEPGPGTIRKGARTVVNLQASPTELVLRNRFRPRQLYLPLRRMQNCWRAAAAAASYRLRMTKPQWITRERFSRCTRTTFVERAPSNLETRNRETAGIKAKAARKAPCTAIKILRSSGLRVYGPRVDFPFWVLVQLRLLVLFPQFCPGARQYRYWGPMNLFPPRITVSATETKELLVSPACGIMKLTAKLSPAINVEK